MPSKFLDAQQSGWFNEEQGELFSGFAIRPEDTFLDVGCGDGGASIFAARQGCAVISTDVLPEKIEQLAKRLERTTARSVRCEVSNSNPLPVADSSVTRVVCTEVMEHVPDPEQFIRELARVGAPNALYMLTVPDPAAEHVQEKLAHPIYWAPPHHVRIFSREQFGKLVTDAGLVIEKRDYYGFYWALWWTFFWAEDQELGEPEKPLLAAWSRTWSELLKRPQGARVKRELDNFMPKSQLIIARKAA